MSKGFMSVDLGQLLAMVEQKGCACDKLFPGLCLAHYAERRVREARQNREAYDVLAQKNSQHQQEEFYASSDQRPNAADSQHGGGRPDTAVRGDRRGKGARPAKAVRTPARNR